MFNKKDKALNIRYGISFISVEQAKRNMENEINTFNVNYVAKKGKEIWNKKLNKIKIKVEQKMRK
jgi:putative alpha-1,2-mannosidase